ncbi:MAG: hypothetical protein BWX55_01604 [Deltaproteobacteria bacterium ADurb.Bin022]|nr:MAG: hypothetical protein BWX55_01604 [Deltaproteobacteria bacterium ADurb.Bin022]
MQIGYFQREKFFLGIAQHLAKRYIGGNESSLPGIQHGNPVRSRIKDRSEFQFHFFRLRKGMRYLLFQPGDVSAHKRKPGKNQRQNDQP